MFGSAAAVSSMERLHAAGVCHGDCKGDNVLLVWRHPQSHFHGGARDSDAQGVRGGDGPCTSMGSLVSARGGKGKGDGDFGMP